MKRPPIRSRRGFTLVELLTVIGIIVVLVSILLPTVGKVRSQALVAATQQQIATIAGAIERYRMEQGGFPGGAPNARYDVSTGSNAGKVQIDPNDSGSKRITMTEAMVLALCGGLEVNSASGRITYNESLLGRGAVSLGPNAARRTKYPAYIDPTPGQMMPPQPWSTGAVTGKVADDTEIPEFIDRFGEGKAILYVRALKGAPGVVPDYDGNAAYPSGTTAATAQYHPALLKPYVFPTPDPNNPNLFKSEFPKDTGPNPDVPEGYAAYFKNPGQVGQPRGKDAFVLISAGPDNKYGTRDDILYP